MKSINLKPEVEELIRLNDFIQEEFSLNQYDVNLIIEEIFVNIVNYSKCSYIKVFFELNDNKLKIVFVDDGIEFNPLLKDNPKLPDGIDDAEIGLNIHCLAMIGSHLWRAIYYRCTQFHHSRIRKSLQYDFVSHSIDIPVGDTNPYFSVVFHE